MRTEALPIRSSASIARASLDSVLARGSPRRGCGHGWDELSRYVIEREIDGVRIRLLDLPGLLLTKEGLRPQDRADAEIIRRALGS